MNFTLSSHSTNMFTMVICLLLLSQFYPMCNLATNVYSTLKIKSQSAKNAKCSITSIVSQTYYHKTKLVTCAFWIFINATNATVPTQSVAKLRTAHKGFVVSRFARRILAYNVIRKLQLRKSRVLNA